MKLIRFLSILFFICFFILYTPRINANNLDNIQNEIYTEQFNISGIEKLWKYIPKEQTKQLDNIGIKKGNWKEISNLNLSNIFNEIFKVISEKSKSPFKSLLPVISIMIVSTIFNGIKPQINKNSTEHILNAISTLCICIYVIKPIVGLINTSSLTIKSASNFILCYVPIMSAIMIASGQTISATSYHTLVLSAGKIISHVSEKFILPFMSIVLGISIISSLSPNFKLEYICKSIHKSTKTILKFISSIFTSILALQNLVSSSADSLGANVLKSTAKSCVPVIGVMISSAFDTIYGSLKLLKTGVGAFGIIVGGFIFLPIIIECILWIVFINISEYIGNVLEIKNISVLLKSLSNVVSTIISILIFSMIILIISSGIVMIIGGTK